VSMGVTRTHDATVGAHLLASGGRLRRLAHDMVVTLEVSRIPAPHIVEGVSVEALESDPKAIAVAASAATPPDHADHEIWLGVDRTRYWKQLLAGEGSCGAVMPEPSRVLRSPDGAIVGVVVVAAMRVSEWWPGGPWIPEIFVVPDFQGRGLGGLLLAHAMGACVDAGHQRLGLTVTQGNPAQHLYERFGFRTFRSTWFIERGDISGE
jgi:GNAT superfamily N-acetyltransferase